MRHIDSETEEPQLSGDRIDQEIRAAEQMSKTELLRLAWDRGMCEGWGRQEPPHET